MFDATLRCNLAKALRLKSMLVETVFCHILNKTKRSKTSKKSILCPVHIQSMVIITIDDYAKGGGLVEV